VLDLVDLDLCRIPDVLVELGGSRGDRRRQVQARQQRLVARPEVRNG
jgi:hypothetical protein